MDSQSIKYNLAGLAGKHCLLSKYSTLSFLLPRIIFHLEAVGGVSLAHVKGHHTHCYLRLVGIDKHYDYAYLNLLYYIFVFGVMMIICLNSKIRICENGVSLRTRV